MSSKMPNKNGKPEDTVEDEFDRLFDAAIEPSDRPTPLVPEPLPLKVVSESNKPTIPADGIDVKRLFELTDPGEALSSAQKQLADEVHGVLSGTLPGLKPSPIPRFYGRKEAKNGSSDDTPSIEITGSDEIPLADIEDSDKKSREALSLAVEQCISIYHEMDMNFSAIYGLFLQFRWKDRALTVLEEKRVAFYFLQELTNYLWAYISEHKTNVVQSKLGLFAERCLYKVATVRKEKIICDEADIERLTLIKMILDSVSPDPAYLPIAEAFIEKVHILGILS